MDEPKMNQLEMDQLMTTEEAGQMCRKPAETMRYYRHTGLGPRSFKLGRRVVYRREDVEAWLQQQYLAQVPEPAR
jgi:predicted DNA-binding transcriptional regulator AlpA